VAFLVDELHQLSAQFDGLIRVIGDAQHDQHVGPAHDPQADLAVGVGHVVDLLQWVFVGLDHVVQEVDCAVDYLFQACPIDGTVLDEAA